MFCWIIVFKQWIYYIFKFISNKFKRFKKFTKYLKLKTSQIINRQKYNQRLVKQAKILQNYKKVNRLFNKIIRLIRKKKIKKIYNLHLLKLIYLIKWVNKKRERKD